MTNQVTFPSLDIPQPKVSTDKNGKTIGVRYSFGFGRLPPVRIIARWDKWLDWENKRKWGDGDHNLKLITFEDAKPFLSRRTPSELIRRLKRYAKDEQSNFLNELFDCILAANDPKVKYKAKYKTDICKPRGRRKSYTEFEKEEINKKPGTNLRTIKFAAKQLYVFLQSQSRDDRLSLINIYGIKDPKHIKEAAKFIIEEFYNFDMIVEKSDKSYDDVEMFYRKYIADDPERLRRFRKDSHIKQGNTPILRRILSYNPKKNRILNKASN